MAACVELGEGGGQSASRVPQRMATESGFSRLATRAAAGARHSKSWMSPAPRAAAAASFLLFHGTEEALLVSVVPGGNPGTRRDAG